MKIRMTVLLAAFVLSSWGLAPGQDADEAKKRKELQVRRQERREGIQILSRILEKKLAGEGNPIHARVLDGAGTVYTVEPKMVIYSKLYNTTQPSNAPPLDFKTTGTYLKDYGVVIDIR